VRQSTWRSRELHVRNYIAPAVGTVALARLTPAQVEAMTGAMLARGLSARSAASCRVTLRRALGDALRDGYVARNVAALARPPRVPTRDMLAGRDYLEPAQVRRLIDATTANPLGPLVALAATTGLRQGELLGLAWVDVDSVARTLRVRRSLARAWTADQDGKPVQGWALQEPKTPRSRRTINLPAVAVAALEARKAAQDAERQAAGTAWQDLDGLVFTDTIGRPLNGSAASHAFTTMLKAAGLPSVPFHGLRHSAATALLAAGVPLRTVADVLGHSTITITADTYAAVVPELRRDAADAMDRVLGGAS
jgi:integrase